MNGLTILLRDWFELVRSRKARPFLLLALCADSAFLFVFLVAIQSYLPEQHGGGTALPGYALASYGAAKLAAQLVAGRLVDRVGSARAAQAGLVFIFTGEVALLGAIAVPASVLAAAAVYGFGSSVLWPALYARASRAFARDERAKLGAGFNVTTGVALIIGLGLGLILPGGFPYWGAVLIAVLVIAIAAAPALALAGQHVPEIANRQPKDAGLRDAFATALDAPRLRFAIIVLLEAAAVGSLQAIFRSYGRDLLGVSFRRELLYLAPAVVAGAGAVVIGGALADRFGRYLPLAAGFVVAGVALWLLANALQPAALIPLAAAGGMGAGLAMPSMSALSMDLSRTAAQGTVLAWFMMMEGLGHAGGAALGGWLNASTDPAGVLRLSGALFMVVGAGAALSLASGSRIRSPSEHEQKPADWPADVRCEEAT